MAGFRGMQRPQGGTAPSRRALLPNLLFVLAPEVLVTVSAARAAQQRKEYGTGESREGEGSELPPVCLCISLLSQGQENLSLSLSSHSSCI